MAKKFIISDDTIILGEVEFHLQLVKPNTVTKGGGRWHVDTETKKLILYHLSTDYGACSLHNIKLAVNNMRLPPSYQKLDIVFSNLLNLEDAKVNNVMIREKSIS